MQSSSATPAAASLIGLFVATTPLYASARPDAVSARPDAASARPDAVSARPDAASARPDAVSARPDAVSARPDAVSAHSDPVTPQPNGAAAQSSTTPAPSSSSTTQPDVAAARHLFDEARGLSRKGQYADACPKFEQSYGLDPGIGTLFNLADCWEHLGRTASAWATFREVANEAARAHQRAREQVALKRAQALLLRVSKVVVRVTAGAQDLQLLRDGVALARAELGEPIPIDPGQHAFEARAPGKRSWRAVVNVPPGGQAIEVRVPALADVETAPAAPIVSQQAPAVAHAQDSKTTAPPIKKSPLLVSPLSQSPPRFDVPSHSNQVAFSYVAGGVGVVALAAGTFFGLRVLSKNDEADLICRSGRGCTEQDQAALDRANDAARSARTMAVVSFGVGGAALATAVALYLTTPSSVARAWQLTPTTHSGALGATLQGGF
ncbi:MAG TPA: hypothetical protein VKP30_20415 [Polyangiaceae bacterium]|nr:hypothetical protein [Polyangiaceae bacterium]